MIELTISFQFYSKLKSSFSVSQSRLLSNFIRFSGYPNENFMKTSLWNKNLYIPRNEFPFLSGMNIEVSMLQQG